MDVGSKIIELRESLKLTQQEFSERLGVSRPTVSKLENDGRLTKAVKRKLVNVFKLPEDFFAKGPLKKTVAIDPDEFRTTLNSAAKFSSADQQLVIDLINSINEKMDALSRLEKIKEVSGVK